MARRLPPLQPVIMYVQKGIRLDGPLVAGASSSASASASVRERFDDIEVPILVRLRPSSSADRRAGDRERTHRRVSVVARLRS